MTNSAVQSLLKPIPPQQDQFLTARPDVVSSTNNDDRFDDYIEDEYVDVEPTRDRTRSRDAGERDEDNFRTEHADRGQNVDQSSDVPRIDETHNSDHRESDSSGQSPDDADTQQSDDAETTVVSQTNDQETNEGSNPEISAGSEISNLATVPLPTSSDLISVATKSEQTNAGHGVPQNGTNQANAIPGTPGGVDSKGPQSALTPPPSAVGGQAAGSEPGSQPSSPDARSIMNNTAAAPAENNGAAATVVPRAGTNDLQSLNSNGTTTPFSPVHSNSNTAGTGLAQEPVDAGAINNGVDIRKALQAEAKLQDKRTAGDTTLQSQAPKTSDNLQPGVAAKIAASAPEKLLSDTTSLLMTSVQDNSSLDLKPQPIGTLTDFARPLEKQPMVLTLRAVTSGNNPSLPVDKLALHISRNLSNGVNKFQIRLDPPELGRIDVKMEVNHDGRVQTTLAADRPETLDLLQRDAKLLQRALEDAGLKPENGSLSFSLRDQNESSGNSTGMHGQDDETSGQQNPETAPDKIESATNYIADIDAGRVDIRI